MVELDKDEIEKDKELRRLYGDKFIDSVKPITPDDPIGKAVEKIGERQKFSSQLEYYIFNCLDKDESEEVLKQELNERIDDIFSKYKKYHSRKKL